MNIGQKILLGIGVVGLILLSPVILYTFGNSQAIDYIGDITGGIANASTLTFIAFCMIGLMALLGGGKNGSATLISLFIGFLFISTAVDISFMTWFKDLVDQVSPLANHKLNLLTGVFILLFGMFLSFAKKISLKVEFLALVVLPISFLLGSSYAGILPVGEEGDNFKISMNEGFSSIKGMIKERYMQQENVQKYVNDVEEDASLTEDEKVQKMQELQEKIEKIESEEETLKRLKEENEKYKELIKSQEKQIKNMGYCASSKDSSSQVKNFIEAVVSNQPCVRDFAVSLVKEQQGAYYDRTRALPGEAGIRQICDLHYHLSSNWKYISDPTMIRNDYYSPANRTIALGLAGDCDDFSVLNAACIEAIGGVARIMAGFCSGGGHAWAEVLIGRENEWNVIEKRIRKHYNDPSKALKAHIDKDGLYWLSLDWHMGQFTCSDNPKDEIELYTSSEQVQ